MPDYFRRKELLDMMMKMWKILILSLALGSCAVSDVNYTVANKEADFSGYSSFAWIPKDSARIDNVLYDNEIIGNEIIGDASEELKKRGFTVNTDTPDLLLQYTIMVEKNQQIISSPTVSYPPGPRGYIPPYNSNAYNSPAYDNPWNLLYYSNPGNVYNPGYYANNYPYYSSAGFPVTGGPYTTGNIIQEITFREGTLIIDVIDRKKNELIWRGWSTEALSDPNNFKQSIPKEVQEIFRKFPGFKSKR